MRIVATYSKTVQTSEDTWRIKKLSNVFGDFQKINEIMKWAKSLDKDAQFNMLEITEVFE